ncbi:hypothetical protein HMPREF9413_1244 [Paenibacillus sp. HGF7]|nr:hypothetical protein HMPREF9413_1244 [Paenibacillus sp. HGF7]
MADKIKGWGEIPTLYYLNTKCKNKFRAFILEYMVGLCRMNKFGYLLLEAQL